MSVNKCKKIFFPYYLKLLQAVFLYILEKRYSNNTMDFFLHTFFNIYNAKVIIMHDNSKYGDNYQRWIWTGHQTLEVLWTLWSFKIYWGFFRITNTTVSGQRRQWTCKVRVQIFSYLSDIFLWKWKWKYRFSLTVK